MEKPSRDHLPQNVIDYLSLIEIRDQLDRERKYDVGDIVSRLAGGSYDRLSTEELNALYEYQNQLFGRNRKKQ